MMSAEEFENNLTKLQKSNPDHEIIPVLEDMGHGALACEYLKLAMQESSSAEKVLSIDALHRKKDNLYSRRAALSNKFHTCTTDQERKEISIAISTLQTLIVEVRQQIDEYFSTGKLPEIRKKSNIPVDGRRKEKKLHSVRSSISYFRNKLMKEVDPLKIKEYEQRIAGHQQTADELSA